MALAKIIAIANQKGGVAKTTTCLSLGASLAEAGRSVLLIDLDPQAHLTLSLGLNPTQLRRTVSDALLGNNSLVSITRETDILLLDLAPANQGLVILEKVLYGRSNYEDILKNRLDAMGTGYYDVVIMDCLPAFGTLMLNALTAADLLIVPTQCEYYASHALLPVLKLVQLVRRKTNPALSYRLLITMFDESSRIAHILRKRLQESFSGALLGTVIDMDPSLKESPVFGQPVNRYAPGSRAANQYRLLAQELMNHA
jgi:chromosome partitioning protein